MDKNEPDKVIKMLTGIEDVQKQKDCFVLLELFKDITKEEPKLWNGTMVGFGQYEYRYESGREGKWFLTGFAPRKNNLVIYLVGNVNNRKTALKELGSYKESSSCLYLKSLKKVDLKKLRLAIEESVINIKTKYTV